MALASHKWSNRSDSAECFRRIVAGRRERLGGKMGAPRENVCPRHGAELLGSFDADEPHDGTQVIPVGAAGVRVVDIGEPLGFARQFRQPLELGAGQKALRAGNTGGGRVLDVPIMGPPFPYDKIGYRKEIGMSKLDMQSRLA